MVLESVPQKSKLTDIIIEKAALTDQTRKPPKESRLDGIDPCTSWLQISPDCD